MKLKNIFLSLVFLFAACTCSSDQALKIKVEKVQLHNGLRVLLVQREEAPVFSAYMRIKVGNIEEPPGSSGLAHFFEHMAFKGTSLIGVSDPVKEKEILQKIHALGTQIVELKKQKGLPQKIEKLQSQLATLQIEHQKLMVPNEFVRIVQRNGGSDVNATTSNDYTSYYVSLPSNKLELWAYLESQRLIDPVFREFYKERDVVAEERRMRYDNSPDGRLYEQFMLTAFDKSPYKIPVIGFADEIQNYTYEAAESFYTQYYNPSRIVISLVGDFDIQEAKKYIHQYFDPLPQKVEKQISFEQEILDDRYPKEKVLTGPDEPRFYMGFHRPAYPHEDDEVFDVLETLLCSGRTSRLYSTLVIEKRMASQVGCYAAVPGSRLDGLFTFYGMPLTPYTNRDVQEEIKRQLHLLKSEVISYAEIEKIKNRVDADLIWALKSNDGLASMLTFFESLTGDWKYMYKFREKVYRMTPEDIQKVAQKYFIPSREVSVYLEKE